jgi:hypothetical protein
VQLYDDYMTENGDMSGCVVVDANQAVVQTVTVDGSMTLCGQRGGTPFVTTATVDENGDCPDDYHPCSTTNSYSVCIPEN